MLKKIPVIVFLFISLITFAKTLSPDEALNRVQTASTRSAERMSLKRTFRAPDGEPAIYIFDNSNNQGFIILSADDSVVPVLGYSETNTIDPNNLSPAFVFWMEEYVRQIQYVRENGLAATNTRSVTDVPEWAPIEPMVKTVWNQMAPFNNLCPSINGQKAPTGCVATAMSQVMKYFNYPAKGKGSVSYNCKLGNTTQTLSMDFSNVTFDWANMIDSYNNKYNSTQGNAVALLMQAAGYSVEMQYNLNGSGAYSSDVSKALVNNFGYDPEIRFYYRSWFDYSDWASMIYENISKVGPVIYSGHGTGGGHEFVLDGYQSDGYFHFNWGWGGSSDGYYLLNALDPYSLGTGGGTGGFNFDQGATLNIKPATSSSTQDEQKTLFIYGSLSGRGSGSLLSVYVVDTDYPAVYYLGLEDEVVLSLGLKIEELNNPSSEPIYLESQNFKSRTYKNDSGYYLNSSNSMQVNVSKADLQENVKYKVTLVYYGEGFDWTEVKTDQGYSNYFYMTKSGSGATAKYNIEVQDVMMFTATDVTLESELFNNLPITVKGTLTNNNDRELTRSASVALLVQSGDDYEVAYTGENYLYTLSPGESITETWITELEKYSDENYGNDYPYYLALFDYDTGYVYYISDKPVNMEINEVDYQVKYSIVSDVIKEESRYVVDNSKELKIKFYIEVEEGIFNYPVTAYLMEDHPTMDGYVQGVLSYPFGTVSLEAGDTGEFEADLSYPDAQLNKNYYAAINIVIDGEDNFKFISLPFVFTDSAAVGDVYAESSAISINHDRGSNILSVASDPGLSSVDIYSVSGSLLISAPNTGGSYMEIDMNQLPKGVVVVHAVDKKGRKKSVKIGL